MNFNSNPQFNRIRRRTFKLCVFAAGETRLHISVVKKWETRVLKSQQDQYFPLTEPPACKIGDFYQCKVENNTHSRGVHLSAKVSEKMFLKTFSSIKKYLVSRLMLQRMLEAVWRWKVRYKTKTFFYCGCKIHIHPQRAATKATFPPHGLCSSRNYFKGRYISPLEFDVFTRLYCANTESNAQPIRDELALKATPTKSLEVFPQAGTFNQCLELHLDPGLCSGSASEL